MTGQESNPSSLFRLYVDYGRYTEATNLLLEYIESFASVVSCNEFHPFVCSYCLLCKSLDMVFLPYVFARVILLYFSCFVLFNIFAAFNNHLLLVLQSLFNVMTNEYMGLGKRISNTEFEIPLLNSCMLNSCRDHQT